MLPSAMQEGLQLLHRVYSEEIVHEDDVLLNVFPKHQAEIEAYDYPAEVHTVLDPESFVVRLCQCRAVISSRLHGAIFGLHSGVPTLAAWPTDVDNKVPALMKDVMHLPEQFLLVNESLTRQELNARVSFLRNAYRSNGQRGRRSRVFKSLARVYRQTQKQLRSLLGQGFGSASGEPLDSVLGMASGPHEVTKGGFWTRAAEGSIALEPVEVADPPYDYSEIFVGLGGVGEGNESSLFIVAQAAPEGDGGGPGVEPGAETAADTDGKPGEAGGVEESPETLVITAEHRQGQEGGERNDPGEPERGSAGMEYWWRGWGAGTPGGIGAEDEVAFGDTLIMTCGTLFLICMLVIPSVSSASKRNPSRDAVASSAVARGSGGASGDEAGGADAGQAGSERSGFRRIFFLVINYALWVTLAVGFNVCSKSYLSRTRNPVALLAVQGWVGIVVLLAMDAFSRACRCPSIAANSSPRPALSSIKNTSIECCRLMRLKKSDYGVWQAGLLHCVNAVLSSWSVLVGGIAATQALKALEPVVATWFSRWLLGTRLSRARLVSVGVIVVGLTILMLPSGPLWWGYSQGKTGRRVADPVGAEGLSTMIPGIITACACCAVALRNICIKKMQPPPPPAHSLLVCSVVAAAVGSVVILIPWLPFCWEWAPHSLFLPSGLNASLCFVGYNMASFNLLSELSPVGHAVGNASKRVCLFATGLVFGERDLMSPRQSVGALVAFVGLAGYNLAVVSPGVPRR